MKVIPLDLRAVMRCLLLDLGFSKRSRWYILQRISREGSTFCTVVLPALCKHILYCIEQRRWIRLDAVGIHGFRLSTSGFPAFIAVELTSIFNDDQDCALNLWRIRQLMEYLYKLNLPFSEDTLEEAERNFVREDESLNYDPVFADEVRKFIETKFKKLTSVTIDEIFSTRDTPGSVSSYTGTPREYKDSRDGCYLPEHEPFSGYFRSRVHDLRTGRRMSLRRLRPSEAVRHSELLFVPKDSRGPRTIIREPYELVRAQMGYFDFMTKYLEAKTGGQIQFTNQEGFRELARVSSLDKSFSTLDLKSASDSVGYSLCRKVFRYCPAVRVYFDKFRSKYTKLPSGGFHRLRKLAGMGSGFTFVSMALIIWSAIKCGIPKRYRDSSPVYVYGDDVIVETIWYERAVDALQKVGLKVNTNKSFTRSHFRESCGGDFYRGNTVTPSRLKLTFVDLRVRGTLLKCALPDAEKFLLKLERHARECVKSGLMALSEYYYSYLETILGALPYVSGDSPVLGRYTVIPHSYPTDSVGHYVGVSVYVPQPELVRTRSYGINRSFASHLQSIGEDTFTLERVMPSPIGLDATPYRVRLVRRNVSALALS